MARNLVTVDQVVNDFVLTLEGDDYAKNASDTLIHNYALRGIREMGFDLLQRIRSIKLTAGSNNTVELPDDFVDLVKVGIVGSDGLVHVFGENKNINYSQAYKTDAAGNSIDSDGDGVFDRVDSKGGVATGGVEFSSNSSVNEIVIEYIADEARSINPTVHIQAEEALRAYIYFRIIERKSSVPMAEKSRARSEYYNERRKANARLKSFAKEEALKTIRKNFKQSPKY